MQQRKFDTLPPEAKAGQQVIQAFSNLGVHDMAHCFEGMQRVHADACKSRDAMMKKELAHFRKVVTKEIVIAKRRAGGDDSFVTKRQQCVS
jgi:hypothetical protein